MPRKFLRNLIQIASSLLVILSVVSCTSPEYIFVEPEPILIPDITDFIDSNTYEKVHEYPDIIEEPQNVNDLLYNISGYRNAYLISHEYGNALENYIDAVREAIINYGGENENEVQNERV